MGLADEEDDEVAYRGMEDGMRGWFRGDGGRLLEGLLVAVPVVVQVAAVVRGENPLSFRTPWGFPFGFAITGWMVNRCSTFSGAAEAIPDESRERLRALVFGLGRTFEVILLLCTPVAMLHGSIRSELVFFGIMAKVAAFASYSYWVRYLLHAGKRVR